MTDELLCQPARFLIHVAKVWICVLVLSTLPSVVIARQNQNQDQAQTTAQPKQEESLADTAYRLRLENDLKEFCAKKPNATVCKNTPEEMAQKIIKNRSPEQIAELMQHMEKVTGNDHSWVDRAGGISTGSSSPGSPSENNFSDMPTDADQAEMMGLSCDAFAKETLLSADPEFDVPFLERNDWERRLCQARTDWHNQYLRWQGHKGMASEVHERKVLRDRWKDLQDVASMGAEKAQHYVDKHPSAL